MLLEKAILRLKCEIKLVHTDSLSLRGYFGNLYRNRPEFHGHYQNEFIYKHPLIQYKIIEGNPVLIGVKEGAYLLKAIPELKEIDINREKIKVYEQHLNITQEEYGTSEKYLDYKFITPWIGLNEENFHSYKKIDRKDDTAQLFLQKILIGNILSMSKSFKYTVKEKLVLDSEIKEYGSALTKKDLILCSFKGHFSVNFKIPDFWGIGKSSSKGFGTVLNQKGE